MEFTSDDGSAVTGHRPSLLEFLQNLQLGHYAENFHRAGADVDLLPILTDTDLKSMGIGTIGARKKILLNSQELTLAFRDDESENNENHNKPTSQSFERNKSIFCFFSKGTSSNGGLDNQLLPPSVTTIKKSSKKGWAHAGAAASKYNRAANPNPRVAKVYPFRDWQLVDGTNFVVDRFCNLPSSTPLQKHWFLTHFHSDHYKGLTSKFNRGTIYCTPITAALLRQQLHVRSDYIKEVTIGSNFALENTKITFLPANHCPGAAMILFEPPGRTAVLHTGDCRLGGWVQLLPELISLRRNVNLILDTTYCDPQYCFPPQEETLKFVVDAVKAEAFNPKTLFLFGSYTIGKEKLYLQAAKTLGCKVYVSATKKKILDCLDLAPDEAALLTTDDAESNLHAVPLWMISQKHMKNSLKYYRGRFTNVVGFQPTGWTHTRDTTNTKAGKRRQKGTLITYQVPYSEHSSYSELKEFVSWLDPRCIVPSVNNDGGAKLKRMMQLLAS